MHHRTVVCFHALRQCEDVRQIDQETATDRSIVRLQCFGINTSVLWTEIYKSANFAFPGIKGVTLFPARHVQKKIQ